MSGLVAIFLLALAFHICKGTLLNVTNKQCPLTEEAWKNRENARPCEGARRYHCFSASDKQYAEVCLFSFEVKPRGRCPYINLDKRFKQLLQYFTCTAKHGCPSNSKLGTFASNKLYKYPACLVESYNTKPYLADKSTDRLGARETKNSTRTMSVMQGMTATYAQTTLTTPTKLERITTGYHDEDSFGSTKQSSATSRLKVPSKRNAKTDSNRKCETASSYTALLENLLPVGGGILVLSLILNSVCIVRCCQKKLSTKAIHDERNYYINEDTYMDIGNIASHHVNTYNDACNIIEKDLGSVERLEKQDVPVSLRLEYVQIEETYQTLDVLNLAMACIPASKMCQNREREEVIKHTSSTAEIQCAPAAKI